jgi:hypothetical protein
MMTQDHTDNTTRALTRGKAFAAGAVMLALGACVAPMPEPETETGFITNLPAQVIALADPTQNLQAVRIMDDGCYWYEHAGPVETTMLPLRTPSGSPICTPRSS